MNRNYDFVRSVRLGILAVGDRVDDTLSGFGIGGRRFHERDLVGDAVRSNIELDGELTAPTVADRATGCDAVEALTDRSGESRGGHGSGAAGHVDPVALAIRRVASRKSWVTSGLDGIGLGCRRFIAIAVRALAGLATGGEDKERQYEEA